jgi:hypothetical protein
MVLRAITKNEVGEHIDAQELPALVGYHLGAQGAAVGVRGVYAWGNRAEVLSQFPGDEPGDELQGSGRGAPAVG